jgi:hypothetical protein
MSSHFITMFLKNRYKVGIKASPAQAVASEDILEFALRGVIFSELIAKLGGLSFLKSKKGVGVCVLGERERSDEVRVLEVGQRGIIGRERWYGCSSWEEVCKEKGGKNYI